jgi:hypothetical protein
MATEKLEKPDWQRFFDRLSSTLAGRRGSIEILAPDLGDQFAAEGVELIGIGYDPKDDALDIALKGLDHRIQAPREIQVERTAAGIAAIQAIDDEGRRQIVHLDPPA